MSMDQMVQLTDTKWQTGFKNKQTNKQKTTPKQEATINWSQKTHGRAKDTHRWKVGIEKDTSCKRQ